MSTIQSGKNFPLDLDCLVPFSSNKTVEEIRDKGGRERTTPHPPLRRSGTRLHNREIKELCKRIVNVRTETQLRELMGPLHTLLQWALCSSSNRPLPTSLPQDTCTFCSPCWDACSCRPTLSPKGDNSLPASPCTHPWPPSNSDVHATVCPTVGRQVPESRPPAFSTL